MFLKRGFPLCYREPDQSANPSSAWDESGGEVTQEQRRPFFTQSLPKVPLRKMSPSVEMPELYISNDEPLRQLQLVPKSQKLPKAAEPSPNWLEGEIDF